MTIQPEKRKHDSENDFKVEFGNLIKERREQQGMTRNTASKVLGVSNSTLQAWENGERTPNAWDITRIMSSYNMSIDELFELPISEVNSSTRDRLGSDIDLDEFYFIPKLSASASAGYGRVVEDESITEFLSFRKDWIDHILKINAEYMIAIDVNGDSMEGEINDKDLLLINKMDTSLRDGIYVLRIDSDLIVKRIQKLIGGVINVVSANTVYKPFEINTNRLPDDFAVIGRVVWFGRSVP